MLLSIYKAHYTKFLGALELRMLECDRNNNGQSSYIQLCHD